MADSSGKQRKPSLSKSQYMLGRQCTLALWNARHRTAFNDNAAGGQMAALRDFGHDVGELAKLLYPQGVEVKAPHRWTNVGAKQTQDFAAAGEEVIFEAVAVNRKDGTHAAIDILRRVPGTDQWDMIEVKSAGSVKSTHIEDLAFQHSVFTGAGYVIRNCILMHVNMRYVRHGDIDPQKFFAVSDVTAKVKGQESAIAKHAEKLGKVIMLQQAPQEDIGSRCDTPYSCRYKAECWKGVPLYSIFNLASGAAADKLVRQVGSYDIDDLPDHLITQAEKKIELEAHRSGKLHAAPAELAAFAAQAVYPLYFLDYEGMMPGVPLYDGTHPFQSIPFQFSLHVQDSPGAPLVHHSFLHKKKSDPREAFADALVRLCGNKGSVVVYNRTYEETRNKELAKAVPRHAAALDGINARMLDLYVPFRNRWLYHPDQRGSASLKNVLPAFTPLSYKGLTIGKGEEAAQHYLAFAQGRMPARETKKLWPALEVYCGLDTLAMVELLEVVRRYAAPAPGPAAPCPA